MAATGWLRGVIKEVPSGDTLVIAGTTKPGSGAPPEKRITLSSLIAPKMGKRDMTTRDDPFAWASREFLRTKCVGQTCVFRIDYVVEQLQGREFGSVFLNQTENVALAVAGAGMAKVRTLTGGDANNAKKQSPYMEDLKKAEEVAQASALGVWSKDQAAIARSVREPPAPGEDGAAAIIAKHGKGVSLDAVVEAVLSGSGMRVTLTNSGGTISVLTNLAGVQCPSMGRRAPVSSTPPAAASAEGEDGAPTPAPANGPSAATIAGSTASEPHALEAKLFTESRVLNRDVKLVLEGVDKFGNLYGTVMFTPPAALVAPAAALAAPANGAAAAPTPVSAAAAAAAAAAPAQENLAEQLLKGGLAKCVEWSLNIMSNSQQPLALRRIEQAAKEAKLNVWQGYVAVASNQTKLSSTFSGKVVEIVSGDCVVVKDSGSGLERRVNLSSIRAPRPQARERAAEPWAHDAKDYLRKRCIGRPVDVKLEYTRKVSTMAGVDALLAGEREMVFGNVELAAPEGSSGEEKQNISELAVSRGFASVIRHRTDEERSCIYERLSEVEEMAKQAKRGMHSNKDPPVHRTNDVSAPGNATKAKQFLPFLQRAGRTAAVVEYVLSGHRLKLYVPKEGVTIVFAPSGIRTPSRAQLAGNGRAATQAEPLADEAIAFTRELLMQRDVEIVVETMDRGGTFLGSINITSGSGPTAKQQNFAVAILRAGLAKVQETMDVSRLADGHEMERAQKAAKEARLKIWTHWSPEQEAAQQAAAAGPTALGAAAAQEVVTVSVTEVTDATEFFIQVAGEPRMAWITETVAALNLSETTPLPPDLKAGQLCLAQFSLDNQWYRAHVERVNPSEPRYDVYFLDFGNRERVSGKKVASIDSALAAVPAQAIPCQLAYIKVPAAGTEHAAEAKYVLNSVLGGGRTFLAHVVSRDRADPSARHPKARVAKVTAVLVEPESNTNVAVELLSAGVARLPRLRKIKDPAEREAVLSMEEYQEEARHAHRGMFQYGDPGDSEDEEESKPIGRWAPGAPITKKM